jgi:VanZ family protein
MPPLASDKVVHVVAFAVLSFLFALAWSLRRPFGWQQFLAVLAILAAYAAFDEATQPLVQRTADRYDWIADLSGALGGLAIFAGARTIWWRTA